MAESLADVTIKLVQMALITAILIIMIYRKRKYKIRQLNWFIWIFGMADLQGVAEIVIYFLKTRVLNIANPAYFRFNEWHSIPYSLAIVGIYLLAEFMIEKKPNTLRFSIVVGSWSAYLTLMLYQTFKDYAIEFTDQPASHQFFTTIFDFFQLFALTFATYVFYRSFRNSTNTQNKRATFLLFLSAGIYMVVIFYELGENLLGFPDIYGAITFSLTFVVLAFVFIKWPYYVFTVPIRIYRLALATNSGVHIYSAEIKQAESTSSDELLVGGVSAITAFMSEAMGSEQSLRFADFGDRSLIVHQTDTLIGFLIADRSTYILDSALEQFIQEFGERYHSDLVDFKANIATFSEATDIIARCFPFVESQDIIKTRSSNI